MKRAFTKEEERRFIIVNYISLLNRFSDDQFNDDALVLRTFNNAKKFSKEAIEKQNRS
jgi:hypothetical protein